MDDEQALLKEMTDAADVLDSGCCGMAGSFGFESAHAGISNQVGELVLLPAVRRAAADTLIVADGFSCREQIAQNTGRRAVHTADVLEAALAGWRRPIATAAEDGILPPRPRREFPSEIAAAAMIGAGVALALFGMRRGAHAP